IFDVYELAGLTAFGYLLLKLDCEPAPLILGFVLGPLMEENLRRALMIAQGDASVFFVRPISAAFLVAAAALMVLIAAPTLRANAGRQTWGGDAGVSPVPRDSSAVQLERIDVTFGTRLVVSDIDLSVRHGEFVCLVGQSGCGKTTLLRLIAGLLAPTNGVVK